MWIYKKWVIPKDYFDFVYDIYAIGWTTYLQETFNPIASYLKKDGIFIFSWKHPLHHFVIERFQLILMHWQKQDLLLSRNWELLLAKINCKLLGGFN